MADSKASWRVRTKAWALLYLGGQCLVCGSDEDLEFDHVEASTKSFDISVGIRDGYGRARLSAELDKCQLLCHMHHREKTVVSGETGGGHNKILDPQHGSAVMYGAANRCRCIPCREWKKKYRAGLVDSLGRPNALVV